MCMEARLARCPLLVPSTRTNMTGIRSDLQCNSDIKTQFAQISLGADSLVHILLQVLKSKIGTLQGQPPPLRDVHAEYVQGWSVP